MRANAVILLSLTLSLPGSLNAHPGDAGESWLAEGRRFVAAHGLAGNRVLTAAQVRDKLWEVVPEGPNLSGELVTQENGVKIVVKRTGTRADNLPIGTVVFEWTNPKTRQHVQQSFASDGTVQFVRWIGTRMVRFHQTRTQQKLATIEDTGEIRRGMELTKSLSGDVFRRVQLGVRQADGSYRNIEDFKHFSNALVKSLESLKRFDPNGSWKETTKQLLSDGALHVVETHSDGRKTQRSVSPEAVQRYSRRYQRALQLGSRQRTNGTGEGRWNWTALTADFDAWVGRVFAKGNRGRTETVASEYISPLGTVYGRVTDQKAMTKPSKQRPMPEGIWRALDLPRQWTNHSFRGDMSQVTDAHRKQLAEVVSAIWKLDGASLEKRGVPRPGVRISAETNPENAFANSVQRQIIFGTGLATRLDESAKAGIVAHELGHLRDTDRLLADGANIDHEARWLLSGKVADGSFAVGALLPALVAQLDRSEKRRKQERIADGYAGRVMAIARENGKRWSPRSWFRNVFRSNQPWTPVSEYDSASERWRQFRSTYLRSQKRLQRVKHAPSKGHL